MLLLLVVLHSLALCSAQLFNCYNLSLITSAASDSCREKGTLQADVLLNVGTYDAGENYSISLIDLKEVPSITIVQARLSSGYYTTVGRFSSLGNRQTVVACRNQYDTLISNETSVTFEWTAPDSKIEGITFHYTVVTENGSNCFDIKSKVLYPRDPQFIKLIQAHGSMMITAWCIFVPCAIMLVLFYKIVLTRGEWFYAHIVIQIIAILLNIASVVVIFTYGHFNGGWTTTTNLNWPHQIIGLFAFAALLINPFLAICRCHQESPSRWVYNYIHGSIGMVALLCSLTAMLLGLNIYKTLVGYTDYSHYAIYALSGTIAVILSTIALYNIYALNFNIRTAAKSYVDPEVRSSDWFCRVVTAIIVVLLLIIGSASTIIMMALA